MRTKPILNACGLLAISALVLPAQVSTPAPTTATDEKVLQLEKYLVTDRQDSAYKAATAITGTKTDTPLIQVPQAIQVITLEQIEDLGAIDITDLYPLMGSVTEFSYGGVSARGFRQEQTSYNGVNGSPYNEFGILTLNNVQQVEVLKGPVGLLYGDNEPGGMINIVTATPRAEFGGSITARAGSFGLRGGEARVTGPLDAGKRLLYLANLSYTERDGFRDNFSSEALNATGALTWVVSPATRLTGEIEYIDSQARGARLRGVPFTEEGFVTSVRFNSAEATDLQDLETTVYNLRFDHAFSEHLRLNAYYRYFESEAPQAYHEPNTYNAATGIWQREFRHQLRNMYEESAAANLIADFRFLGAGHKLLTGVEYYRAQRVFRTRTVNQSLVVPINVLDPVYGQSSGSMYDISLDGVVPNDTEKTRIGYYLQDQVSIGTRWHLLGGLRYEYFDDVRTRPTTDEFDDAVFTYRGGAVYMIRPDIAAYVSYAMGLKPQSLGSEDFINGPFDPQESESWETGLKFDFLEKRFGVTTSVYEIRKTNILERDPTPGAPSNARLPLGEVTSRGFEIDLNGQLTANWNLTANYAYNDAKVTDAGAFGSTIGSRFPNAPHHKGGLWTRYNLPRQKLGFGAGLTHVGTRPNFSGATNLPGPAYTIYTAAIYYRLGRTQFSLKCENVTDEIYSKSVFSTDGHFPGTPRSFTLTAIHRF